MKLQLRAETGSTSRDSGGIYEGQKQLREACEVFGEVGSGGNHLEIDPILLRYFVQVASVSSRVIAASFLPAAEANEVFAVSVD